MNSDSAPSPILPARRRTSLAGSAVHGRRAGAAGRSLGQAYSAARGWGHGLVLAIGLAVTAAPAFAVQPDEMLADPVLEARARDLSQGLRCLVCRNESIDDSDADLAHDLRVLLRERIAAGDSDQAAVDYIVARYGEFVLLKPTATGGNLLLWLAGPLMLLGGGAVAVAMLRSRSKGPEAADLSAEDQARLEALLRE